MTRAPGLVAVAGDVRVRVTGSLAAATEPVLAELVRAGVPAALLAGDAGLWGPDAEPVAAGRLGWLAAARPDVRPAVDPIAALGAVRAGLAGFDRVVLVGIGGSSLAAEVVADAYGCPVTVLDTTDCDQFGTVLAGPLDRTLVVVASKSGETIETSSGYAVLWQAFAAVGLAGGRFVAVTDPGSTLARSAAERGFLAVLADPTVGGRYSALTAFGLVPAGLLGADLAGLGLAATRLAGVLDRPAANPGLLLGAALGAAGWSGRDVLALRTSGLTGRFGDWVEQLLAESTGKAGRGLLPVLGDRPPTAADVLPVLVTDAELTDAKAAGTKATDDGAELVAAGPLGAQFLLWEYATAVAGRVLGVNPFDEPDVTEAKVRTRAILAGDRGPADPAGFTEGAVEVELDPRLAGVTSLAELFAELPALLGPRDYLAVTAFLDRYGDAAASRLVEALADRTDRPVSFGWGPRYLHSTGQYHKGGPARGVFLMITGEVGEDIGVPGGDRTLAGIQRAQARADRTILRDRGRPVLRLHLRDRRAGLAQLLAVLAEPVVR